jgi:hypothetical protein
MLPIQTTDCRSFVRLLAAPCGIFRCPATTSRKIVKWRARRDFRVPIARLAAAQATLGKRPASQA